MIVIIIIISAALPACCHSIVLQHSVLPLYRSAIGHMTHRGCLPATAAGATPDRPDGCCDAAAPRRAGRPDHKTQRLRKHDGGRVSASPYLTPAPCPPAWAASCVCAFTSPPPALHLAQPLLMVYVYHCYALAWPPPPLTSCRSLPSALPSSPMPSRPPPHPLPPHTAAPSSSASTRQLTP